MRAHQAVSQGQLGFRELAIQIVRLLEQGDRLGVLFLAAQDLTLSVVGHRQIGIHLLGELERLPRLVVLAPAQPHEPDAGPPARITLLGGALECLDGILVAATLKRGSTILEVVRPHRDRDGEPRPETRV